MHIVSPPPSYPNLQSIKESTIPAPDASAPGVLSLSVLQRLTTSQGLQLVNLTSCLQHNLVGNVRVCHHSFFMDDLWPPAAYKFNLTPDIFDFLTVNKLWDLVWDCFIVLPHSVTEAGVRSWLNMLSWFISEKYSSKRTRLWSDHNCNQAPDSADILRKPDLILLDRTILTGPLRNPSKNTTWPMVLAFAEVTSSAVAPRRIPDTVNNKSYLMFLKQEDR